MNSMNENQNQDNQTNQTNDSHCLIDIDLPDIEILTIQREENGDYIIHVKSTLCGTNCRKCGQHTTKYRKTGRLIKLRELPIFGSNVFIQIKPIFYHCQRCHANTVQKVEWYKTRSPNTLRFEEHILLQLVNSTVQDVAKKE